MWTRPERYDSEIDPDSGMIRNRGLRDATSGESFARYLKAVQRIEDERHESAQDAITYLTNWFPDMMLNDLLFCWELIRIDSTGWKWYHRVNPLEARYHWLPRNWEVV